MITSVQNDRVKRLVALRQKARERRKQGVFLVEGIRMYKEAPANRVQEIYVSERFSQQFPDEMETIVRGSAPWEILSDEVFKKVSDTVTPQGILCVVKIEEPKLEELLSFEGPAHFLLLEETQDPGNLGTMLRTAEAAGVTGIIAGKKTADLYNPKVIRSTMGAVYRVPYLTTDDFCNTVNTLRSHGVAIVSTELEGSVPYDAADYTGSIAFLIGNEGNGLSREARALADVKIRIPMEGETESLNAAVAAALCMYEVHRQRA